MTVKGIEVSGTIYNIEDENAQNTATEAYSIARTANQAATTANQTATEASQAATTANQTATEASQTATTASQTASENSIRITAIESVIPSSASSTNKLTTESDTLIKSNGNSSGNTYNGDLDDLTDAGMYSIATNDSATNHAPTGYGVLIVFKGKYNSYITQQFISIVEGQYTYTRRYDGVSWSSWQKLVTESNLSVKKIDISATSGATSFSVTIPLSIAQRNKVFSLEIFSVGDNNAIAEMKYLVFVSSLSTSVSTKEISKDSIFTNISITFDASEGYKLSFSSTGILYSTILYIQQ